MDLAFASSLPGDFLSLLYGLCFAGNVIFYL